nr:hypothetical protein Iba_chr02cCG6550 [Ipomoea batatas]
MLTSPTNMFEIFPVLDTLGFAISFEPNPYLLVTSTLNIECGTAIDKLTLKGLQCGAARCAASTMGLWEVKGHGDNYDWGTLPTSASIFQYVDRLIPNPSTCLATRSGVSKSRESLFGVFPHHLIKRILLPCSWPSFSLSLAVAVSSSAFAVSKRVIGRSPFVGQSIPMPCALPLSRFRVASSPFQSLSGCARASDWVHQPPPPCRQSPTFPRKHGAHILWNSLSAVAFRPENVVPASENCRLGRSFSSALVSWFSPQIQMDDALTGLSKEKLQGNAVFSGGNRPVMGSTTCRYFNGMLPCTAPPLLNRGSLL